MEQLEQYILGSMTSPEKLLMDGNLLINSELKKKIKWQQEAYQLIQLYGRNELKVELETIHDRLFSTSKYQSFASRIFRYFKR